MWAYYLLVFLIILLQLKIKGVKNQNILFCVGIICLFLFAAMRGNGAGDYFAYLEGCRLTLTIDDVINNKIGMEISFRILSYIINLLGMPAQTIIIIMNVISLLCIYIMLMRYSPDRQLSLLLFLPLYFQFDMHAARTAVAIGIITLGLPYIFSRKPVRFMIIVLLAMSFHEAAVISVGLYLLYRLRYTPNFYLISIIASYVMVMLVNPDLWIYRILKILSLNKFAQRYLSYVQNERFGYEFSLFDIRIFILITILFAAISLINSPSNITRFWIKTCWANILIMVLFSKHTFLTLRFSSYYNIFTVILVPIILQERRNNYLKNSICVYSSEIIGYAKQGILAVVVIYGALGILYALKVAVPYTTFF